jgi:hypothetical protein
MLQRPKGEEGEVEKMSQMHQMQKQTQLIRRGAGLIFITVTILAGLSQLDRADAQQQTIRGRLRESDCSYLKDPRSFDGLDGRHRVDLSRQTEAISDQLQLTAAPLVAAQEMPRKNYIDSFIFDRMGRAGIDSAPLCTDQEFIRRVSLDLTGRIPTPEAVKAFLSDTSPSKRDRLVDSLIASPNLSIVDTLLRRSSETTPLQATSQSTSAGGKPTINSSTIRSSTTALTTRSRPT